MKKNPRIIRTKAEPIKPENLIVTDIVLRNVDRTPKDVGRWRAAHINAESVHYPNRTRLYDLYSDVMLDSHLSGIIYNKRIATVRNKNLVFKKNGKKVDEMDIVINSKVFRDIITKILETPAYGITGLEFVPGEDLAFEDIPRKHIKAEFGVIALEQSDYTGYEYAKVPNIFVIGEKYDLGYLLSCSFYALIKKSDFSDWAQYVEIFGQPIRVIKYDAYDSKTKGELKNVLDESGSSLAIMIPKQTDFEIMDGKTSNGDGKLQESLKNACNEEMSVKVLGVTETTTSSKSSGYAQSETHQEQQSEVVKDDIAYTLNYLNDKKFIAILKSYGLPVDGGAFEFEKELDLAVLSQKKDIDLAVSNKVPVGDDYWYETYGIPKPDNYDDLKQKMEDEKALQQSAAGSFPSPRGEGKGEAKAAGKKNIGKMNMAANMPEYEIGDRVKSLVNHMEGMKGMTGKITIVEDAPYYGVTFDGETKVHKWLAEDEIEPVDPSLRGTKQSASKKKIGKMNMSAFDRLRTALADFFDPAH